MHLAAVARALPPHRHSQDEIAATLARVLDGQGAARALSERLHRASQVQARHLALPLEAYPRLEGFGAANDAFIRVGTDLAAEALTRALDRAGLRPRDLDLLVTSTVTGVATPSLDARLVNRLGLRSDVRRVPLFGLGCVAGAAGLARLHDHLRGWPEHVAALVTVELCSLTFQRGETSGQQLVATSLFGDGAAAVVATGAPRPGASRVVATRSRFYPDTERAMGWDVTSDGFRVVLAQDVPALVRERLGDDVRAFLADHGLAPGDIAAWVCHPGGPKVLEAAQAALGVDDDALALSWRSLREVGNLSSASVLLVLEDTLRERPPPPGARGVLLAMGPGFCAELVLLAW
ncbi:MAG: type III polyketide synthase [Planctomycetes bacterium]|nr:type III polyketide synthase [Planctomycetota bacterium]